MRLIRLMSAGGLLLALTITVPALAQRGHEGNGRGHEKQADHGKPEKAHNPDRLAQPRREHGGEPHRERAVVEHRGNAYGHDRLPPGQAKKLAWGDYRARAWAHEHRSWKIRGGYRGYVVPRERFVAYFGPRHLFRVHTLPVVVIAGHPRFHYKGFYVTLVDPWPEYWAPDWYESDDVYVDYVDDGYYMYNQRHPGVAIAVNISL
jgi:hypothetical protein